jgi:hypothetical protein
MIVVTLYTKPGCHLCEPVRDELLSLQEQIGFELVACNIQDDVEAWERYRYLIPVVEVGDSLLFHAPIDLAALRQAVRSHTAQGSDERRGNRARSVS